MIEKIINSMMDLRKIIEKIFKGINTEGTFCTQKKSSFLGGSHGKLVLALIPKGDIFEPFFLIDVKGKNQQDLCCH